MVEPSSRLKFLLAVERRVSHGNADLRGLGIGRIAGTPVRRLPALPPNRTAEPHSTKDSRFSTAIGDLRRSKRRVGTPERISQEENGTAFQSGSRQGKPLTLTQLFDARTDFSSKLYGHENNCPIIRKRRGKREKGSRKKMKK